MDKNRKKWLETGKSVLIAVLVVTALLLGQASGLFGSLPEFLRDLVRNGQTESTEPGAVEPAAQPFLIAVTLSQGARYGLTWGEERLTELYGRFSATLGEALGSSGTPEEVTEAAWRAALSGPGVYFDFLYEQPLSVLSVWLGTEITGGASSHTARRICLALEEDGLWLSYMRARGGYYRCTTALSTSALSARLGEYTPNGASFVWELSADDSLDPYALLMDGLQTMSAVTASNPLRSTVSSTELQELFGFNMAWAYTEADGTTVYVQGDATLRVFPSGTVSYRSGEGDLRLGDANLSTQGAVEAARQLCERGPGQSAGAGKLSLAGVRYDQDTGAYTIRFNYGVDGIPVLLQDGPAVEIVIAGGMLLEAQIEFRSYTLEPETVTPLPTSQALAMVRAVGGGEPLLAYVDDHSTVSLQWLAA